MTAMKKARHARTMPATTPPPKLDAAAAKVNKNATMSHQNICGRSRLTRTAGNLVTLVTSVLAVHDVIADTHARDARTCRAAALELVSTARCDYMAIVFVTVVCAVGATVAHAGFVNARSIITSELLRIALCRSGRLCKKKENSKLLT